LPIRAYNLSSVSIIDRGHLVCIMQAIRAQMMSGLVYDIYLTKKHMLEVNYLSCVRQQKEIFSKISFELTSSEALLIQGENGSGKSSLLRLIAGLATPQDGKIFWRGQPIQTTDYRAELHYIGHTNGIKLGLTVLENLQLI